MFIKFMKHAIKLKKYLLRPIIFKIIGTMLFSLILVLFFTLNINFVSATTITVTSNANSGAGTLRQALLDSSDGDIIVFNLSAGNETIIVSSTLTTPWNKDITIDGDNSAGSGTDITIQVTNPGTSTYPTITITGTTGKTTTLRNLTLRGGDAELYSGGTIRMELGNNASLVLYNCIVKDGRGRFGGGLFASDFDTLTIEDTTFQDNSATDHGGAARFATITGTVNIINSKFINNSTSMAVANRYGGALYFQQTTVQGTVNIDKTLISGNSSYHSGGGIYLSGIANLNISNSTISNNESLSGSGIYATGGNRVITNTTISGNKNNSISGMAAYLLSGASTLTNVTILDNNSGVGKNGLRIGTETLYIKNSLLAKHDSNDFHQSNSTIHDNGYNLVEVSSDYDWTTGVGNITGPQDDLNIDLELKDNSSPYPAQTHALLAGSVAIDAGDSDDNNGISVPIVDQRDFYRNGAVDIGAFEYEGLSEAPLFTLTYLAEDGGSLTGSSPQSVAMGSDGEAVTAVPDLGYHFVDWSDSSIDNPRTDTNIMDNISVSANFDPNTYEILFEGNGSTGGSMINQGFIYDQVQNLSANSYVKTNYTFDNWNTSADGSGDSYSDEQSVSNLTSDDGVVINLYAQWINQYTLTYATDGNGTIVGEATQTVEYGENGTAVEAVPNEGYYFVKWSDDSLENPRTDINVIEGITVEAIFALVSGISNVSTESGSNEATITWNSDVDSSSKVFYGSTSNLGLQTEKELSNTTSHSVTLSDLIPCTRYYYQVQSEDEHETATTSTIASFGTTGCEVGTDIEDGVEEVIDEISGGELEFMNNSSLARLIIPNNYANKEAAFQINRLGVSGITTPTDTELIDENIFKLVAVATSDGEQITVFDNDLTFVVTYDSSVIDVFNEDTLDVYRYNDGTGLWNPLGCELNKNNRTLTCIISNFSVYGVFGVLSPASSLSTSSSGQISREYIIKQNLYKVKNEIASIIKMINNLQTLFTSANLIASLSPVKDDVVMNVAVNNIDCSSFDGNLSLGMTHSDVKCLQEFLNQNEFILTESGPGSPGKETDRFGGLTRSAVIRFQEYYKDEVLAPLNLKQGTGFVGASTRKKLNELLTNI
jgi:predicted outer membrane repeat protein